MAQDGVSALGNRGAVLGAGIAARARPIAQKAVGGLRRRLKALDDIDDGLQAGGGCHGKRFALSRALKIALRSDKYSIEFLVKPKFPEILSALRMMYQIGAAYTSQTSQ